MTGGSYVDFPYDRIREHIGHNVVAVGYGSFEDEKGKIQFVNVAIECEDCNTVITDANYYNDEEV